MPGLRATLGASALTLALALGLVAACGGDGDGGDASGAAGVTTTVAPRPARRAPQPPAATAPPTSPPTTSLASTTTAPSTTTSTPATTTTAAPTTTLPPLPVPLDAPVDPDAAEPVVELATIEIPRLGLTRRVYEGIRLPTLDRGPGHWPGTAMPGQLGNVVVAGHRVSHHQDFRDLDQLAPGDEVIFSTLGGRYVYAVTSTEIVQPDAVWIVDQTREHRATLFACHPPGSVAERIVVHLVLTDR